MNQTTSHLSEMHKRCNQYLIKAMNDPEIRSLLPDGVKVECQTCDCEGYFDFGVNTIYICADRLQPFQSFFNQSLKHEAIHARDIKYAPFFNDECLFRACTEIRAAKLSGQCSSLLRDFMRLTLPDFEGCIYKKATISTECHPPCRSKQSVDKMWNFCFNSDLDQDLSQAEIKS